MRIVGGNLRGRMLAPPTDRTIRPTSDRTREAIFNILRHSGWGIGGVSPIDGAAVLDAFCGTGALGLEALSQGAAQAVFLDQGRSAIDLVRENVKAFGLIARTEIIRADATVPPSAKIPAGLVFLDPPYGRNLLCLALTNLARRGWLAAGAVIVAEMGVDDTFDPPSGVTLLDQRSYGETVVAFCRFSNGAVRR